METYKILVVILIFVLAFVWGGLGGINETSNSRMKSSITYIAGSCISAIIMLLVLFILKLI